MEENNNTTNNIISQICKSTGLTLKQLIGEDTVDSKDLINVLNFIGVGGCLVSEKEIIKVEGIGVTYLSENLSIHCSTYATIQTDKHNTTFSVSISNATLEKGYRAPLNTKRESNPLTSLLQVIFYLIQTKTELVEKQRLYVSKTIQID